jgi:hypothetical protein
MRIAKSGVEEASITDHALSLCDALVQAACPIALFIGDLAAAERFVAMLLDYSARHVGGCPARRGRLFKGVVADPARRCRSWVTASPLRS